MTTTKFQPNNKSLKTGMLVVNKKGAKSIILMDGHDGEDGRVSGETWHPIYKNGDCWTDNSYFYEIWSENSSNREALSLSTDGRTLLWTKEPPIKIGNDIVEFGKHSIKVGCTSVSHAVVRQIYERISGE